MANVGVPQQPQNQPAESPIMGLYLDRPAHMIDPKGFSACNNVRIEFGRVRSDLIGWAPGPFRSQPSNLPFIYLDSFTNSLNQTIHIGVTPTDVLKLDSTGAAHTYITPTYTTGNASINNGSTALVGTGTRWATDIQFGTAADTVVLAAGASTGDLFVQVSAASTAATWLTGLLVTSDQPGAVAPGTYINNVQSYLGNLAITLSKPLLANLTNTNHISIGNSVLLRQNVRPGDQIAFGTTSPGVVGALTWLTVASVNSDTSITLTGAYFGTNLSNVSYVVRQCLTNTLPTLPPASSDAYLASSGYGGYPSASTVLPAVPRPSGSDLWLFTNSLDPVVVYYDTQGSCQYARTIPFLVFCLKAFKSLVIYGGLNQPPALNGIVATFTPQFSSITSSDSGFPLQLNTGIGFQGIALSGPFTVRRIGVLGSVAMLYGIGDWTGGAVTEESQSGVVTSASLVGFPTIWSFSDVVQTRGLVSANAMEVFSDRHQFLSIDGEYRYNGLFVQVMNDQVWRAVLKNFDYARQAVVVGFSAPGFGDLIWAIPQTSDPGGQLTASTAYVEAYMEQANSYLFKPMTRRDFPFWSAAVFEIAPSSQPSYFAADAVGNIWQLYTSNTQNGVPALATVTWGARKIGNGRARVLVTRVYPEIEYQASPAGTVAVMLTLQNYAAGPVTITDIQPFNLTYPGGVGYTTHFRRGAVASVTLSDSAGVGWVCQGYDWDYLEGGVRLKA
jgi:hypothetical protein